MNTAKVYYNIAGEEMTIHQMVKYEPEWAANRIQAGEKAESERDQLRSDLADALDVKLGKGPTALAMVVGERDQLRAENKELRNCLKYFACFKCDDDSCDCPNCQAYRLVSKPERR